MGLVAIRHQISVLHQSGGRPLVSDYLIVSYGFSSPTFEMDRRRDTLEILTQSSWNKKAVKVLFRKQAIQRFIGQSIILPNFGANHDGNFFDQDTQ